MALYCAASLACALSTSIEMLIAARALQALGGSGGIVLARAIVRDLYSGARAGPRIVADRRGDGAGAGAGAARRRRAADRLRLALGFFHAGRRRACSAPRSSGRCCRKRCALRAAEPVSPAIDAAVLSRGGAQSGLSRLSRPRLDQLCRTVRLDFRRVLRAAISLWPVAVPIRRRLRGRLGRLHDRHDAGGAAGDAARHRPHARRRRGGDGGRRARHGDGGGARA